MGDKEAMKKVIIKKSFFFARSVISFKKQL